MNDIIFRPISDEEYKEFKDWEIRNYANNMMEEGQFTTLEDAMKESVADFTEGLPNDLKTPYNYLVVVQNSEEKDIGLLWYETKNKKRGFIEDIIIMPQYRRQGYGIKVLHKLGEDLIRRNIYQIVLHVFESNIVARKLYEESGLCIWKIQMLNQEVCIW